MEAGGGVERFLDEHAVIVMADHSQVPIEQTIALQEELSDLEVLPPTRSSSRSSANRDKSQIAVCPSQRAAMVYLLGEHRRQALRSDVIRRSLQIDGVDLVMWLEHAPDRTQMQAVIARPSVGELRFAPEDDVEDERAQRWTIAGDLSVLAAELQDGHLRTPVYPDALARVWAALSCENSGDVLLSAAPGYEFLDWGRQAHVGGGSHGSLHASDSLGALILCGVGLPEPLPSQWAIRDVSALIASHFGVSFQPS
jgi:hypothetical protein